jgi:hypothetical protein
VRENIPKLPDRETCRREREREMHQMRSGSWIGGAVPPKVRERERVAREREMIE